MKPYLKLAANLAASVLVLPIWVLYGVHALVAGQDRAVTGWSQLLALLPGTCGVYIRKSFYRLVFPHVGNDAWISFGTIFSHATTSIGETTYLGPYCVIGDVEFESDVLLGSQVSIANGTKQHGIDRLDIPVREQPGQWPKITIGRDTWIGDRAIVMADVGRHCVIGAGAVVVDPIPDYAIAVGNPARIVKYRNELAVGSKAAATEATSSA